MESLLACLSKIPDPRRAAGRRHDLSVVLFLSILGVMEGADGYRSIGRFIRNNVAFFLDYLPLKKPRLPSTATVSRVLGAVDMEALSEALSRWIAASKPESPIYFLAGDGKAIKASVENSQNSAQNYISVCSFFDAFSKVVVAAQTYENGKKSEIKVFQDLIEKLDLKGEVVIGGDALHAQKKL